MLFPVSFWSIQNRTLVKLVRMLVWPALHFTLSLLLCPGPPVEASPMSRISGIGPALDSISTEQHNPQPISSEWLCLLTLRGNQSTTGETL